ncbi:MAG: insulinase family protein [Proteobacteria bacterium]|nr:insulinase family protein [Pseudomonadota bacterium]
MSPHVVTYELENGLRVVAVALPHLHTATIGVFVRVGSRFEAPSDNGLSHFVEHMLFRGSDAYPTSRDLAFAIESLGGTLDAETGRDLSLFHITVEPTLIDSGLALLGEVVSRPRLGEIDLERSIIIEEMREDYDEDGVETHGEDIVRGLLFGDHPLGQRVIGSEANVRRFGEADLRRHLARHYCAENMLVCVAGPVAPGDVVASARAHMSALPAGQVVAAPPLSFDQAGVRYRYIARGGSQTDVHVLFRAVPDIDPDYMASVGLLRAIDDGMSTPLHYELCDRRGLAYSVGALIEPLADTALLDLSSSTGSANVSALLRGMLELVGRFRTDLVTAAELTRIKRRYRNDLFAAMDDGYAMANWFGGTMLYYPPPDLDQRLAQMDSISAHDIREVARRILCPDHLAIAVVGRLSKARQGEVREIVNTWR